MEEKLVDEIREQEYERGMEDAWEIARKIAATSGTNALPIEDFIEIFLGYNVPEIFKKYSAKEAKEKIDNYIKKKDAEFHVGDEVTIEYPSSRKGVVILSEKSTINVTDHEGHVFIYPINLVKDNLTKTGRHFDEVEELFKMLKED